jgi:hypothetical protein
MNLNKSEEGRDDYEKSNVDIENEYLNIIAVAKKEISSSILKLKNFKEISDDNKEVIQNSFTEKKVNVENNIKEIYFYIYLLDNISNGVNIENNLEFKSLSDTYEYYLDTYNILIEMKKESCNKFMTDFTNLLFVSEGEIHKLAEHFTLERFIIFAAYYTVYKNKKL